MTDYLGPYELNSIITGDARELAKAIPDRSIDLIFTDPIYSERELYALLAQMARRVLKPSGVVLCWSNGKWHRTNANWLEEGGLTYRWDFACVISTGPAPMNGKIISKTNRLIWLDVEQRSSITGYLADGYASVSWSALYGEWAWTKNPKFSSQAIDAFCGTDGVIFDPFCGEGTTPSVCKMLNRQYLAFEINPDTAERARERVRNTQPPLFVMQAKQAKLEL